MAESIMLPVMKSISCIAPRPPLPRVLRVKRWLTNRGAGIRKSAQVGPGGTRPKDGPCRCRASLEYVDVLLDWRTKEVGLIHLPSSVLFVPLCENDDAMMHDLAGRWITPNARWAIRRRISEPDHSVRRPSTASCRPGRVNRAERARW